MDDAETRPYLMGKVAAMVKVRVDLTVKQVRRLNVAYCT